VENNVVLVRYGEVTLKSPYVRELMEKKLIDHIKFVLRKHGYERVNIRLIPGRIFINNVDDAAEVANIVSKVFGVVSTSPAVEVRTEIGEIKKSVVNYALEVLKENQSFAIRARRVKRFPITSKELEKILGAEVLDKLREKKLKVNLTSPDVTIYVEVRSRKTYIYHEVFDGVGGLPYGVEGKAISLVSGGIDSPVATWLIMKRGVKVIPVFFNGGSFTSREAVEKAHTTIKILREWVPEDEFYFYEVSYGEALRTIVENVRPQLVCLACKRTMLKTAIELARIEGAKAIVTGESLGQVASQTLDNIFAISYNLEYPILRPLIGLDKDEIVELARKIGTYNVSSRNVIECQASPAYRGFKAIAHADVDIVLELEKKLDIDRLAKELVKNSKKIPV